jgi:hypothetical protein
MTDGGPKRLHPLMMMPMDNMSDKRESSGFRRQGGDIYRQSGKGKGGKGRHKLDANSGNTNDFILPEMTVDPWLQLYYRLSFSVRERETRHLSDKEKQIIEEQGIPDNSTKRRIILDPVNPE